MFHRTPHNIAFLMFLPGLMFIRVKQAQAQTQATLRHVLFQDGGRD